ncbi:hypothetical protein ACIGZJ_11130 [Kitasatospora sp. NPDC052868]|uniref:hypothetical protein n=1 Tax=Kitasatospora sp. NPDC052868 TaxID=3364060 RepID=UPI0037CC072A
MSTPPAPTPTPAPAAAPAPAPAPPPAAGAGSPPAPPSDGPSPAPEPGGAPGPGGDGAPAGDPAAPSAPSHSVGAGESAAEATARTGQSSKRKDLLRQARLRVEGDAVGGDKIVIMAGEEHRLTLRSLSPAVVEAVRHSFQEPPRWDEIRTNAWRRRSVVLRGPAGAGKTAAAVRLLLTAQSRSWYLLDSVAQLTRLTAVEQLGQGAGLLLNCPADAAELRGPLLESLEHELERSGAHLVLTVGTDVLLNRGVGEYVQRLDRPPVLDAVVRAHLARRIGESAADDTLDSGDLKDLVAELLGADGSCRTAARLAEVLADEHAGGVLDPDRVRTLLDQGDGQSVDDWFDGLAKPELRAQAVALAVLNGLPQEDVAAGGAALLARFRTDRTLVTVPPGGQPPLIRDPFANPRRAVLEQLRARTVATVTRGQYGWLPCTITEYRDGGHAPRVIRHVWSEYDIQAELLDWLGELVDSASEQVRSFAGTALGVVATGAFDHLSTWVFPGWIRDEDTGTLRREAVAYALRVCVEDPALRAGVRAMVDGWYLSGTWQAQAAAARAYGLCLGGADLATAVEALARMGTVDDIRVAIAIGDSFADLIEEDVEGTTPVVLTALVGMMQRHESRATGHLAFLILADALVTEIPPPAAGAAPRSRPTLLHLVSQQDDLREQLAHLWSEVIGGELFGAEAAGVLRMWASQAEADPHLLDDLLRMLRDLAQRTARNRDILLRYASRWDAYDELRPLRRSAALLRAVLAP